MNYKQSKQILEEIKKANRILLNCHASPDADTVSSSLAMYQVLTQMGKKVRVVCPDSLPSELKFLPNSSVFEKTDFSSFDYSDIDLFIVMDTSTWDRVTGDKEVSLPDIKIIKIDHHSSGENFGIIELVHPKSSATCELLYEIFQDWEIKVQNDLATCLLAGILADTGSFQFEVEPKTLRIGADLMESGADREAIRINLFRSMDFENAKYLGKLFNSLHLEQEYKFMWTALSSDDVGQYGFLIETYLLDVFLQSTAKTDFGMRIIEKEKGKVSVSFRSRTGFDTGKIASKLGGGGHIYASGATLETKDFQRTVVDIVDMVKDYIKKNPFSPEDAVVK